MNGKKKIEQGATWIIVKKSEEFMRHYDAVQCSGITIKLKNLIYFTKSTI